MTTQQFAEREANIQERQREKFVSKCKLGKMVPPSILKSFET